MPENNFVPIRLKEFKNDYLYTIYTVLLNGEEDIGYVHYHKLNKLYYWENHDIKNTGLLFVVHKIFEAYASNNNLPIRGIVIIERLDKTGLN